MMFCWSLAKDTPFLRRKDTLLPRGRAVAMVFFDFLIGNWVTKIACTFCGLVMFQILKHCSLKIRIFLIILIINQVKIYIAQPISMDWAEQNCAWKEPTARYLGTKYQQLRLFLPATYIRKVFLHTLMWVRIVFVLETHMWECALCWNQIFRVY